MRSLACMLAAVLMLDITGCAAMFHGTSDQIVVQSPDPDAKLYVDNMLIGRGTATTSVKRNQQHMIIAKKPGCEDHTVQTTTAFDGISLLGVLIDAGLVSMLVVDWGLTGAMFKTDPLVYHPAPICEVAMQNDNVAPRVAPPVFTAR